MFRISSSSWKREAVFKKRKLDICSLRIQSKKYVVWKCMPIKRYLKKNNCVKFQMFNIQVKKIKIQNQNQIQNYFKSHIIFSFVK